MERKAITVSVMDAIEQRRSIRSFRSGHLDTAAVLTLLQAAVEAPTARHEEPWGFVVLQDRALLKRISDHAISLWPPDERHRHAAAQLPITNHFASMIATPGFNIFHDAGTLIVICGMIHGPFVAADCWLAAENLMLAATARGLGTCLIGSAVQVLNTSDVKAELGIPPEAEAIVPVVVGVPAVVPPATGRREPLVLSWK